MLINASQIDSASLNLAIQRGASGASFSGNLTSYVAVGGWLGNNVVYVTGGTVDISGDKGFVLSPRVPYSGGTGNAPSARWVNDQIISSSGGLSARLAATSGVLALALATTGTNLYTLLVNASGALTGQGGGGGGGSPQDVVYTSGAQTITGVKTFVSSPQVPDATHTGPGSSSSSTVSIADMVVYSGALVAQMGGGGGAPDSVTTTGTYIMAGAYTFSGSPLVPSPTAPSGAANLSFVSGASGQLFARVTGISGALQAAINAAGGGVTNNYSFTGTTGNYINMSFYFDQYNLTTGLNSIEAVVGRSFFFTGYSIGTIETGTQGFFSGSFYQRTPINTKTRFIDIFMNSGTFFKASGGYNQEVSGLNRVGLDIFRLGTGITGLTLGLFGVGY